MKNLIFKISISVIVITVLALCIWMRSGGGMLLKGKKTSSPSMDNSFNYVNDSIALCEKNIEKLEALQKRWNGYESNIEKKGGFWGIGGSPDPAVYKAWSNGCDKIDSALNAEKTYQDAANRLRKEVVDYLNGNELMLEKLTEYRNVGLNDDKIKNRLDSCIKLRELLSVGNVSEVKHLNFSYSDSQQTLKNAIENIPPDRKSVV